MPGWVLTHPEGFRFVGFRPDVERQLEPRTRRHPGANLAAPEAPGFLVHQFDVGTDEADPAADAERPWRGGLAGQSPAGRWTQPRRPMELAWDLVPVLSAGSGRG